MTLSRAVWPIFVLATVLFYSILLFSPEASIHWDLADVSYPVQKYLADSVSSGTLPYWTPYIFSGTPLLADPQVGAWYPLHWPFFLMGIVPRSLAWELALHALLAMAGAYLLARRISGNPAASILAGVFYGFGGYFAAHSTDLALFEAAALLPWLLWLSLEAAETGGRRWFALAGFAGACTVLTGSVDGAAYSFLALVCFAASWLVGGRVPWTRAAAVVGGVALASVTIGAVTILPWIGIAPYTTRTGINAPGLTGAQLDVPALATTVSADYLGLISGRSRGGGDLDDAPDPRQSYLYLGLLALPLGVAGMLRPGARAQVLALIVPALWYAWGPSAGLAKALRLIPAFRDARAPVDMWFVVTLGVALAASCGAAMVQERTSRVHLPYVLIILAAADLWFWNFYKNPLVLARVSFETLYERSVEKFEARLENVKNPLFYRIFAPQAAPNLGPMDQSLVSRTPVTYGHNLLQLNRHAWYVRALEAHPVLLGTLATHAIAVGKGPLDEVPAPLGIVTAPRHVTFVDNPAAARTALLSLNPAEDAIAETTPRGVEPGVVDLKILRVDDGGIRVHYSTAGDTMLRFSIPYAPGWTALVGETAVPVVPMDYAFIGVPVPAGEHEVSLVYRVPGFAAGAVVSVSGLVALASVLLFPSRFRTPAR